MDLEPVAIAIYSKSGEVERGCPWDRAADWIKDQSREFAGVAIAAIPTVAWRYQRKDGWGDIWRVADILPTFETPEHWTVEALGVIGAVEPAPNGGVVRHDIEADDTDREYFCPILGTCPHWLDKCKPIGCQHADAIEMRGEPKAK